MRIGRIITLSAVTAALALTACGDDDPEVAEAGGSSPVTTTTTDAMGSTPTAADTGAESDPTTVTCTAGDGGDDEVAIAGFTFQPGEIEIDAGGSITFANQDPADHSVWSAVRSDGDPAFESVGADPMFRVPEVLHSGDSSTCTFPEAGTYEYLCGVHNSMRGTVTVE